MKDMTIPDEYQPKFRSHAVRITFFVPEKVKQALIAHAYEQSTAQELVTMGEVARNLLMQSLCSGEEDSHAS